MILVFIFSIVGRAFTPPVVGQVVEGSAALAAGIEVSDRIISIDGRKIKRFEDIRDIVMFSPDKALTLSIERAGQLVETVIKSRKKLSNSIIRREKYNLIKEIKESYNVGDFFNGRISNYRILASIYNVFQAEISDESFDPEAVVNSKFTVLEHITSKKLDSSETKNKVLREYNKKDKDLKLLAYQILVDKFNQKYKTLDENQKNLLKNYINNVSNTNSLREYIDTEVVKIRKILKLHLPKVKDDITKIKLSEAINQVENLTKGKVVKDKQVLTLMRYYELIKEIKNVHKS